MSDRTPSVEEFEYMLGEKQMQNMSTTALEAELKKRKGLQELDAVVRQTLANGFTMQDIRHMLARVASEQTPNIR